MRRHCDEGDSGPRWSASPIADRPKRTTVSGMTPDNLHLCSQAYTRFSAGDVDGLLELFHPEVEVFVAPPNFESGTYRGRAEYRGLLERWAASWDEMRIEPLELQAAGDWILARVDYIGRGEGSGAEVTQPSWELSLWQDGLCTHYDVYWDSEQGREAFASRRETAGRPVQ
jgi:ketosteroid isomerase-like protein